MKDHLVTSTHRTRENSRLSHSVMPNSSKVYYNLTKTWKQTTTSSF